eukprot:jgi/Mesvir1/1569/Mv14542-RA.3
MSARMSLIRADTDFFPGFVVGLVSCFWVSATPAMPVGSPGLQVAVLTESGHLWLGWQPHPGSRDAHPDSMLSDREPAWDRVRGGHHTDVNLPSTNKGVKAVPSIHAPRSAALVCIPGATLTALSRRFVAVTGPAPSFPCVIDLSEACLGPTTAMTTTTTPAELKSGPGATRSVAVHVPGEGDPPNQPSQVQLADTGTSRSVDIRSCASGPDGAAALCAWVTAPQHGPRVYRRQQQQGLWAAPVLSSADVSARASSCGTRRPHSLALVWAPEGEGGTRDDKKQGSSGGSVFRCLRDNFLSRSSVETAEVIEREAGPNSREIAIIEGDADGRVQLYWFSHWDDASISGSYASMNGTVAHDRPWEHVDTATGWAFFPETDKGQLPMSGNKDLQHRGDASRGDADAKAMSVSTPMPAVKPALTLSSVPQRADPLSAHRGHARGEILPPVTLVELLQPFAGLSLAFSLPCDVLATHGGNARPGISTSLRGDGKVYPGQEGGAGTAGRPEGSPAPVHRGPTGSVTNMPGDGGWHPLMLGKGPLLPAHSASPNGPGVAVASITAPTPAALVAVGRYGVTAVLAPVTTAPARRSGNRPQPLSFPHVGVQDGDRCEQGGDLATGGRDDGKMQLQHRSRRYHLWVSWWELGRAVAEVARECYRMGEGAHMSHGGDLALFYRAGNMLYRTQVPLFGDKCAQRPHLVAVGGGGVEGSQSADASAENAAYGALQSGASGMSAESGATRANAAPSATHLASDAATWHPHLPPSRETVALLSQPVTATGPVHAFACCPCLCGPASKPAVERGDVRDKCSPALAAANNKANNTNVNSTSITDGNRDFNSSYGPSACDGPSAGDPIGTVCGDSACEEGASGQHKDTQRSRLDPSTKVAANPLGHAELKTYAPGVSTCVAGPVPEVPLNSLKEPHNRREVTPDRRDGAPPASLASLVSLCVHMVTGESSHLARADVGLEVPREQPGSSGPGTAEEVESRVKVALQSIAAVSATTHALRAHTERLDATLARASLAVCLARSLASPAAGGSHGPRDSRDAASSRLSGQGGERPARMAPAHAECHERVECHVRAVPHVAVGAGGHVMPLACHDPRIPATWRHAVVGGGDGGPGDGGGCDLELWVRNGTPVPLDGRHWSLVVEFRAVADVLAGRGDERISNRLDCMPRRLARLLAGAGTRPPAKALGTQGAGGQVAPPSYWGGIAPGAGDTSLSGTRSEPSGTGSFARPLRWNKTPTRLEPDGTSTPARSVSFVSLPIARLDPGAEWVTRIAVSKGTMTGGGGSCAPVLVTVMLAFRGSWPPLVDPGHSISMHGSFPPPPSLPASLTARQPLGAALVLLRTWVDPLDFLVPLRPLPGAPGSGGGPQRGHPTGAGGGGPWGILSNAATSGGWGSWTAGGPLAGGGMSAGMVPRGRGLAGEGHAGQTGVAAALGSLRVPASLKPLFTVVIVSADVGALVEFVRWLGKSFNGQRSLEVHARKEKRGRDKRSGSKRNGAPEASTAASTLSSGSPVTAARATLPDGASLLIRACLHPLAVPSVTAGKAAGQPLPQGRSGPGHDGAKSLVGNRGEKGSIAGASGQLQAEGMVGMTAAGGGAAPAPKRPKLAPEVPESFEPEGGSGGQGAAPTEHPTHRLEIVVQATTLPAALTCRACLMRRLAQLTLAIPQPPTRAAVTCDIVSKSPGGNQSDAGPSCGGPDASSNSQAANVVPGSSRMPPPAAAAAVIVAAAPTTATSSSLPASHALHGSTSTGTANTRFSGTLPSLPAGSAGRRGEGGNRVRELENALVALRALARDVTELGDAQMGVEELRGRLLRDDRRQLGTGKASVPANNSRMPCGEDGSLLKALTSQTCDLYSKTMDAYARLRALRPLSTFREKSV